MLTDPTTPALVAVISPQVAWTLVILALAACAPLIARAFNGSTPQGRRRRASAALVVPVLAAGLVQTADGGTRTFVTPAQPEQSAVPQLPASQVAAQAVTSSAQRAEAAQAALAGGTGDVPSAAPTATADGAPAAPSVEGMFTAASFTAAGFRGDPSTLYVIDGSVNGRVSLPNGVTANVWNGMVTVNGSATLDRVYVRGALYWVANSGTLTVTNSIIEGGYGAWGIVNGEGSGRLVMTDSTVRWRAGAARDAFTFAAGAGALHTGGWETDLLRVDVSGWGDGVKINVDNSSIVDSWIHDLWVVPGFTHNDCVHVSGGTNLLFRNNRMECTLQPGMSNSAIFMSKEANPNGTVVVEGNYLEGGAYTLYNSVGITSARNNVIGPSIYGPWWGSFAEFSNNRVGTLADWLAAGGQVAPAPATTAPAPVPTAAPTTVPTTVPTAAPTTVPASRTTSGPSLPGRVGIWLQRPSDAATWKSNGVEFYMGLWNPVTNTEEGGPTQAQLDELAAAGMPVIASPNAAAYADNRVMRGYMTAHEPDLSQDGAGGPCVPVANVQSKGDEILRTDPSKPRWLVTSIGTAVDGWYGSGTCASQLENYLAEYAKAADVLSFDIYPWTDNPVMSVFTGSTPTGPRTVVDGINRLKRLAPGKPIYVFLSAGRISGSNGVPTESFNREIIDLSIEAGATGFVWFVHDLYPNPFSDRHPLAYNDGSLDMVRNLNAYIQQRMGPVGSVPTPTTVPAPTTVAPTTTRPPTAVAPTTTTTRPPTTVAPTTTVAPATTTTRPPTTVAPTTTTTRPPTTVAPTTTTTRPPTTVAPTTTVVASAPVFRGASQVAVHDGNKSTRIPIPAGTKTGDMVIVTVAVPADQTVTTPSGWRLVGMAEGAGGAGAARTYVFSKLSASESSVTVRQSCAWCDRAATVVTYSGAKNVTAYTGQGNDWNNRATADIPTPAAAGPAGSITLSVAVTSAPAWDATGQTATQATLTAPEGWTKRAETDVKAASGQLLGRRVFVAETGRPQTAGAATWKSTSNFQQWTGQQLVLTR